MTSRKLRSPCGFRTLSCKLLDPPNHSARSNQRRAGLFGCPSHQQPSRIFVGREKEFHPRLQAHTDFGALGPIEAMTIAPPHRPKVAQPPDTSFALPCATPVFRVVAHIILLPTRRPPKSQRICVAVQVSRPSQAPCCLAMLRSFS